MANRVPYRPTAEEKGLWVPGSNRPNTGEEYGLLNQSSHRTESMDARTSVTMKQNGERMDGRKSNICGGE
jgi:hypothetical protein